MAIEVKTPFCFEQAQGAGPAFLLDSRYVPGNVFWVNSVTGVNSPGRGRTPSAPLASIAYVFSQDLVTADQGDVVLVMPGHTETITAAGGVTQDIAGVKVIGLGSGRQVPKVTFTTAATATWLVSAARSHIENLYFECNIDDQAIMLSVVAGSDLVVRDCEFNIAATPDGEIAINLDATSDRALIENCKFHQTGNTAVANCVTFGATDNTAIRNCNMQGYHGTVGAIANGAAAVNVLIEGNYIVNRTADDNNKCIVLNAGTVGLVANNRMAVIDSTSPAPVTAAAAFVSGNYFTGAVGVSASTLM